MHALAGLNSAASVYNAAQSLQAADTAKAQALLDGKPEPANTSIGLRVGFSSSKSQSTSVEERHRGAGSAVQAGGKVAIEATQGDSSRPPATAPWAQRGHNLGTGWAHKQNANLPVGVRLHASRAAYPAGR